MEIVRHGPGDDASAVHRFRYEVYLTELGWDSPEADHENRLLRDALDEFGVVHSLVDDGRIVGTLRTVFVGDLPDPDLVAKSGAAEGVSRFGASAVATTGRFMLAPSLRGGTAILRLMKACGQNMLDRGVRLNYGDCGPHLLPFYEHMGYRRFAPAFNDPNYGWKFPILMLAGDATRMRAVRSPLARMVEAHGSDSEAQEWFASTYPRALAETSARFVDAAIFNEQVTNAIGHVAEADLLGALDADSMAKVLRSGTLVDASAGDTIIRQGETGTALFVVLSGAVDVVAGDDVVASLGAGALVGEKAFVEGGIRSASVVATAPTQLLVLDGDSTARVLERDPEVGAIVTAELARVLAGR